MKKVLYCVALAYEISGYVQLHNSTPSTFNSSNHVPKQVFSIQSALDCLVSCDVYCKRKTKNVFFLLYDPRI